MSSSRGMSENAEPSTRKYPGIEKAMVGVASQIDFRMPDHAEIWQMFFDASLLSVMDTRDPFSSDFVREFYSNLEDPSSTDLDGGVKSEIQDTVVELTHEDLRREYGLPERDVRLDVIEKFRQEREWPSINSVLHGSPRNELLTSVLSLTYEAFVIQDILRHSVMLKSGDTKKITAQLAVVTYHVITRQYFDVADFLLSMIRYTFKLKDPSRHRYNALPLGGLLQRVILKKYPEIEEIFYLNNNRSQMYDTGLIRAPNPPVLDPTTATAPTAPYDIPSSSTRPPLPRGGSVRELGVRMDERFDQIDRRLERQDKKMSGMKKMLKYMMRNMRLKPSREEQREWDSPPEDPPRHSIQRRRRPRSESPVPEEEEEEE